MNTKYSETRMNITRAMKNALLMISEDKHYVCDWRTIVRLTEAGFVSYEDGRAQITQAGKELLASGLLFKKPGLTKTRPFAVAKKYG